MNILQDKVNVVEFLKFKNCLTVNVVAYSRLGHIRAGSGGAAADGDGLRAEPADTGPCMALGVIFDCQEPSTFKRRDSVE